MPAGSPYHPATEDLRTELSELRRRSQPLITESPSGINIYVIYKQEVLTF